MWESLGSISCFCLKSKIPFSCNYWVHRQVSGMWAYYFDRDYTRPDLPTCETDIVPQPSASGPVMPDISAAIAG